MIKRLFAHAIQPFHWKDVEVFALAIGLGDLESLLASRVDQVTKLYAVS